MKKFYLTALLCCFGFGLSAADVSIHLPPDTTGMIYDSPEIMPAFPGGHTALDHYIRVHIKYPEEAKAQRLVGKVYVEFVVEKDGSITNVGIRMGKYPALNEEAMRVVRTMPHWEPGSNHGKVVRVRYTLPITFAL